MIDAFRQWLTTRPGQIATMVVVGIVLLFGMSNVMSAFRGGDTVAGSASQMFVCEETGKAFSHTMVVDEAIPIYSSYSGKPTGYPADEVCTWKEDGTPGTTETYVLLNRRNGTPAKPTFCPTCLRLVVRDNPPARAGTIAPPTEAEYAKSAKSPAVRAGDVK